MPAFSNNAQSVTAAKFEPSNNYAYCGAGSRVGTFEPFGQEMANDTGKWPALRLVYYSWGVDFPMDPAYEDSVYSVQKMGMIPVLTWEPYGVSLQAIANGSQDAYIDSWAQGAKATGKPIFLRFAHEMNSNWYPWAGDPVQYIAAWRHVVDRFRAAGADNVAFVWCPTWENRGPIWDEYYPGDNYVDWVGVDLYNWPRWPRTFDFMVSAFYTDYAGRKPIMIGEVASAEVFTPDPGYNNPAAMNKSQWITDMFNAMNTRYPAIKAFCWFNLNKETDWRVESSPSATAAYRAAVANPRYLGRDDIKNMFPTPTPTPTPPPGYRVDMTHRWASYNGSNKPIEQFNVTPYTTVAQSVYYRNNGSVPDSYDISVSGIPSSWYRFTLYGTAAVQPGDGRYGNLYITPTAAGAYTFTVKATSNTSALVSDSETYTMYVSQAPLPPPGTYNVTVTGSTSFYNGTWAPIESFNILPNATVRQSISYKNVGLMADSYNFSLCGIPSSWYTILPNSPVNVQPGETRLFNMTITPKTSGIYTICFNVSSRTDPRASYTVTYTLYVLNTNPVGPDGYGVVAERKQAYYNGTYSPIENFSVRMNTMVSQGMLFKNVGLYNDSYTISVWGLPSDWYIVSVVGPSIVAPNDVRYGSVNITPKAAGDYSFVIRFISNGNPNDYYFEAYTLHVVGSPPPAGYGVNTTHRWASYNGTNAPIEQLAILRAHTVTQSVYYVNTGTMPDSYDVTMSGIPAAWWRFTLYGNSTVAPGDGRYGNLYITPAAAGDYTFVVKVASRGNTSVYSTQTYTMHVR